jgi:hypothetical protein
VLFGALGTAGGTCRVKKRKINGGIMAIIHAMAFIFCKQILSITKPQKIKRAAFKTTHI